MDKIEIKQTCPRITLHGKTCGKKTRADSSNSLYIEVSCVCGWMETLYPDHTDPYQSPKVKKTNPKLPAHGTLLREILEVIYSTPPHSLTVRELHELVSEQHQGKKSLNVGLHDLLSRGLLEHDFRHGPWRLSQDAFDLLSDLTQ